MKNKYILLAILFIASFTACNEADIPIDQQPEDVEVAFSTSISGGSSVEDLTKASDQEYDRNGAPVYLGGITISVENQTYPSYTYEEEFPFEDVGGTDGDNPITMTIKAGSNKFSAVGNPANPMPYKVDGDGNVIVSSIGLPSMHHYFATDLAKYPNADFPHHRKLYESEVGYETLAARSAQYGEWIDEVYPLYADYASDEVIQNIGFSGTTDVDLELKPLNGRVQIVMENNILTDLGFQVESILYDENGNILTYDNDDDPSTDETSIRHYGIHSYEEHASAWVFNREEMVDGTYIQVTVNKRPKSSQSASDWEPVIVAGDLRIDVEPGQNITCLIYYNAGQSSLEVETAVTSASFEVVTDVNESTQL